jgi:hypothetical protein
MASIWDKVVAQRTSVNGDKKEGAKEKRNSYAAVEEKRILTQI